MQCMNPKARECECSHCLEEMMRVSGARNLVIYNNHKNSIVEWMLSDTWTEIHDSATKGKRGTWITEHDVYWGNTVSGEITCTGH